MSRQQWWPVATAISLAIVAGGAHADERESLEALRQTTLGLIEALVDKGVLTREVADGMLKQSQQKAAQVAAAAPQAKPETTAGGKPVQRIPYVSEAMRTQLRNEVKEEVLAQARTERWGVPNALPSWTDRIKIEGDIRLRYQSDKPGKSNTSPDDYLVSEGANDGFTRAADFGAYSPTYFYSTASTQEERTRERLRLRLGVSAKVADEVGVGVRLATGSSTDRVSTNQTMGQGFNKYQLFVDRAFVRLDPAEWITIQGGRIPNPWFSTEMAWSENLNFEGLATTVRFAEPQDSFVPFATAGWFPLREESPPRNGGRSLVGAQVGASWDLESRTKLKFGLAYYHYKNMEGRSDLNYGSQGTTQVPYVNYGAYEYGSSLRQKGNTLFETNPSEIGDSIPLWGLAYQFKPLVLTASAEFTHFSPFNIMLTAEYAHNTGVSEDDFHKRATDSLYAGKDPKGRADGYNLKVAVGAAEVREVDQWQLMASYRHVGSDAVLDAFTDSDLGLGGTNVQGFTLGFAYGVYRNTNLNVRYLSAKNIDTTLNSSYPDALYKVNSLQVDLNVRF
ncbi:MAG: putative porin [Aquabacterium sp.]|uniref:putative porin n=1 Tax=Aquabacterium sp. TaxID=1872578 RepID=UPI0025C2C45B|nr:putative porin [Aquabacterium sp.]MBI5924877.1 putative porin [Aquabacterium sp.]